MSYAYVCTLCHHLATAHRALAHTPAYACEVEDCECEITRQTPLSAIDKATHDRMRERASVHLDDLVSAWHKTPLDDPMDLPEFLGMTEGEYRAWTENPSAIPVRYLT